MTDTAAATHTPGPWLREGAFVYALGSHGHNRFSAALQRGEPETGEGRVPPAELEANAHLIAATPAMLAALEYEEDAQALTEAAMPSGDIRRVVAIVNRYPALLHQDMLAETAAFVLGEAATNMRRAAIAQARGGVVVHGG